MRFALAALVLIAGCDQVYGLTGRGDDIADDGGMVDDLGVDAPCTLGPFVPSAVTQIADFPPGTFDPAISSDGLEMFYVVQNTTLDIRFATRTTTADPWTRDMVLVDPEMALAQDADPTITADGRSLLFVTNRPDPSPHPRVVIEMTREPPGPWSAPVVRTLNVNADSIDISADGKTLYVSEGDESSDMVYRFTRDDIGKDFGQRTNAALGASFPSVSADETELFYHDAQGIKRATLFDGLFLSPELIVAGRESADLSHDGLRLMYQTPNGIEYIERSCVQ